MPGKKLSAAERFSKLHDAAQQRDSYQIEAAKVELSEQIYLAMESAGVTEAELARRIGASRAYINKALQGSTNFTIESLIKIGRALGRRFTFEFTQPAVEPDNSYGSVTYVIEKPIEKPVVVAASAGAMRNVISLSDYRASKTVRLDTRLTATRELRYAAV